MIKLYGVNETRAFRNKWMLEELGLDYEQDPVEETETRTTEHLKLNPNGKVPVLTDGALTLVESMAINLYLAARYGGGLWPGTIEDQARARQWSFWVMMEMEADLETCMNQRYFFPKGERDEGKAARAEKRLAGPFAVLDDALAGAPTLLGGNFSAADLNVAAVLIWARFGKLSLEPYANAQRWFRDCIGRPARRDASSKGPHSKLDIAGGFE